MTYPESEARAETVPDPVESPCIGVCTLGPGNICIGCFRTTDEIGNWLNYSGKDRARIIAQLPARMEALFSK